MRFLRYLKEEYFSTVEIGRIKSPVFRNPSSSELLKEYGIGSMLRFIGYFSTGEFFVGSADDLIHGYISREAKANKGEGYIYGIAQVTSSGKLDYYIPEGGMIHRNPNSPYFNTPEALTTAISLFGKYFTTIDSFRSYDAGYLQEEWFADIASKMWGVRYGVVSPVLLDPSSSEMLREFGPQREVRFIGCPLTTNFYVAAADMIIHYEMFQKITDLPTTGLNQGTEEYFWGAGKLDASGKIDISSSSDYGIRAGEMVRIDDLKGFSRYFSSLESFRSGYNVSLGL